MFKIRTSKYRHVFCDQPKPEVRLVARPLNGRVVVEIQVHDDTMCVKVFVFNAGVVIYGWRTDTLTTCFISDRNASKTFACRPLRATNSTSRRRPSTLPSAWQEAADPWSSCRLTDRDDSTIRPVHPFKDILAPSLTSNGARLTIR